MTMVMGVEEKVDQAEYSLDSEMPEKLGHRWLV